MPGREDWVHLEPALVLNEGAPKPYKVRLGKHDSYSAVFTRSELTAFRDQLTTILEAPFVVLVLGGDVAAEWMTASVERRLTEAFGFHPDLQVAHEGRPGSVDDIVAAWAAARDVPQRVGPIDLTAGGNVVMLHMTGDETVDMERMTAVGDAQLEAWWCSAEREAVRHG
jgi:hypothetical protein